jgi:hypothetical protein
VQGIETFYALPHPHAQETNIANIEDVEKISYPKWKRAQKKAQTPKLNPTHKPICGRLKNSTSQRERKLCTKKFGQRKSTPQPNSNPYQTQNPKHSAQQRLHT